MITTIDKALLAIISSGGLMALLPTLPGPFQSTAFDTAAVAVVTGLLTWLVPNKGA